MPPVTLDLPVVEMNTECHLCDIVGMKDQKICSFQFKQPTTFGGRNGEFKSTGLELVELEIPDAVPPEVMIQPITGKGVVGNGYISVPMEDLPTFIRQLESFLPEAATKESSKVIISVMGGCADVQSAPDNVEVVIIDHDNLKAEGHFEECEKRTIGSDKCTCGATDSFNCDGFMFPDGNMIRRERTRYPKHFRRLDGDNIKPPCGYYSYSNPASQGSVIRTYNWPDAYDPRTQELHSAYSDRIGEWDHKRLEEACRIASGPDNWPYKIPGLSQEDFEKFTTIALDLKSKPVSIRVVYWYNVATGYGCPTVEALTEKPLTKPKDVVG